MVSTHWLGKLVEDGHEVDVENDDLALDSSFTPCQKWADANAKTEFLPELPLEGLLRRFSSLNFAARKFPAASVDASR